MWNIRRLEREVMCDRELLIKWCVQRKILPEKMLCSEDHPMTLLPNSSSFGVFRCKKSHMHGHYEGVSRAKDTWFSNSKISPEKILLITLCFANDLPLNHALRETCYPESTSTETIYDWFAYCREMISSFIVEGHIDDGPIGGVDKVVELEECKVGKRKFNVGSLIEGTWIVGLLERDSNRFRLEVCTESQQDKESVVLMIKKHVVPGTHILTDDWESYKILDKEHKYSHGLFNQSKSISKGFSGEYVLESSWRTFKQLLRVKSYLSMCDRFLEFLFRRTCKYDKIEPFEALLEVIRVTFPLREKNIILSDDERRLGGKRKCEFSNLE